MGAVKRTHPLACDNQMSNKRYRRYVQSVISEIGKQEYERIVQDIKDRLMAGIDYRILHGTGTIQPIGILGGADD